MQKPDFKHFIVNTPQLFESLKTYAEQVDSDLVCYDLETDSETELQAKVYGIGLAFTELKGFYIPIRAKDGSKIWNEQQEKEVISWLETTLKSRKLIGHNIIYDVLVTEYNWGFILDDYIHADTILMKHTVDEERPFGLKEIAPTILGSWATMAQEKLEENVKANGGRFTKDNKDMYLADTEVLGEYCCWDVLLTLMLYKHFTEQLEKENLTKFFYEDEVMPLYKEVTINMKRKGFPIDVDHFRALKVEIEKEIKQLEDDIYSEINHHITSFEQELLDKKYPIKASGNFPKAFADHFNIALPTNKEGKVTLAKKALDLQKAQTVDTKEIEFYDFIINKDTVPKWIELNRRSVQESMYKNDNPDKVTIFNLASGDHIGYLIYDCLKIEPFKFTESGKPSTDKEVMDELIEHYKTSEPWMEKLFAYRKLGKLLSTYVIGILDRQVDGIIYTNMLQFGTTSSRYASTNPNLNNLPSSKKEVTIVDKFTNAIRKGFIARQKHKIIGCDFNALEPRIASYVSQDIGLMDIFSKGHDFYSAIGIKQFNILDATPFKDDTPNSFPVKYKDLRNKVKTYALAAFYGAEEGKISQIIGCSKEEAKDLLQGYFTAFPKIKTFINRSHYSVKTQGKVTTKLGRSRHLPDVKSTYSLYKDEILNYKWAKKRGLDKERRKYKNSLNNAVNFQIQGLAAQVLNRSLIAMVRKFKANNLKAYPALTIHDEVLVMCPEDTVEKVTEIIKNCMENTVDLQPVGLKANPIIGNSYYECK